jgi:hypothetical protein
MLNIFTNRHIQLTSRLTNGICSGCVAAAVARCVREIVIMELRAIANEFLTEAQNLFPIQDSSVSFAPNPDVAPVELAAAQLFDLHLVANSPAICSTLPADQDPVDCIVAAVNVQLQKQRDLSGMSTTINAASELVKKLGLGSINRYLYELGLPELAYNLQKPNLLEALRNSGAEYAFNFGILKNILQQDNRTNVNAACQAQLSGDQNFQTALSGFLSPYIANAPTLTLCKLLKDMSDPPVRITPAPLTSVLHQRMFISAGASAC